MAEDLSQYFKGLELIDGALALKLAPNGFIEWGPFGYRYTGQLQQVIANDAGCVNVNDEAASRCGNEGSVCCDNQVLREDANCELWAPPTPCVQQHDGSFTGAVSNLISPVVSPGSSYTAETPQLCVPVPDNCYQVQAMAFICGAVSVRFTRQEPQGDDPVEGPNTYSIQGNVFCADFPYEGQDEPVGEGFYWAWSDEIPASADNIHTYNVRGCCQTGVLEPGEAWKPTFKLEISNGDGTNTDFEVVGWRVNYCMDMLSAPPCGDFTEIEDEREFRQVQVG